MEKRKKKTRVLIIEDVHGRKVSLRSLLLGQPQSPFKVSTASTGAQIHAKISGNEADILVIAIPPEDTRIDLVRNSLVKAGPIPVIVIAEQKLSPADFPFKVREFLVRGELDEFLMTRVLHSAAESGTSEREFGRVVREFQTSGVRYLNVILSSADGIVIVNRGNKVLFVNPSARTMMGTTLVENKNGFPFAPPKAEFSEITAISIDGHPKTLEMRSVDTVWEGQDARLISLRDITSRKNAEELLRESEERYAIAIRGAKDGLWDWNLETDSIYYSDLWKSMLGFTDKEIGDNPEEWFSRIHESDVDRVKKAIKTHLDGASPVFKSEHRMLHKDTTYRWVLVRGSAIRNQTGRPVRIAGSQTDITERKKAERELQNALGEVRLALASEKTMMEELDRKNKELVELSITDGLTRLYNHRFLQERFDFEFKRLRRYGGSLSIMILDIDLFKAVNDTYGHQFGDFVLRELGLLLKSKSREVDICGRYGGEEFMIITSLPADEMMKYANKLHASVEDHVFVFDGHSIHVTVSIGIAVYNNDITTKQEMIERADSALYQAKKDGRNLVRFWKEHKPQDDKSVDKSGIEDFKRQFIDISSQMRSAYMQATEALINAVDAKDPFAKEHSHNVSRISVEIAKVLNLPETEIEVIRYAGLLHDIGKIGIKQDIVTKKEQLTQKEFEVLKRHPVVGTAILKDVKFLEKELPIILHHHERYDGTGYPYGLKQREIPLGARILGVADAFDAMTAGRTYKKGLDRTTAIKEIRDKCGTQFSPEIVEAFLKAVELKKV